MTKNTRFSPEVHQRAIRMVLESQGEYDSQWAAICSIAPKIGCTPETLRVWVRQHERDTGGGDGGLTTAERQRLKELERENRELRRSNDILRQASAYFAKAVRIFMKGDHSITAFFKVVVAFCNKITLRSLFFWIQVDF